jgi:hypothetical protein
MCESQFMEKGHTLPPVVVVLFASLSGVANVILDVIIAISTVVTDEQ